MHAAQSIDYPYITNYTTAPFILNIQIFADKIQQLILIMSRQWLPHSCN